MDEKKLGPLLSDEQFFGECLNLDYPGMEAVKEAVADKEYSLAKKEMASYIRKTLDADRFFEIPYEIPENIYKLPGESDAKAAERICNHTLVSVGVPCEYGKENTVDWEANPTYNGYKEWTWQLSRHNDIKLLAHEYNKTRNEKLAYAAAELMDSWMKQAVCRMQTVLDIKQSAGELLSVVFVWVQTGRIFYLHFIRHQHLLMIF